MFFSCREEGEAQAESAGAGNGKTRRYLADTAESSELLRHSHKEH